MPTIAATIASPFGLACVVLLVAAIGALLYGLIEFDRLVRAEHQLHRAAWESDGSPCGFFWWPPDSFPFAGYFARTRVAFAWLFQTPPWVSLSSEHIQLLRRFRVCIVAWNIVCIPLALCIIASLK
jgi:hypothetical protein